MDFDKLTHWAIRKPKVCVFLYVFFVCVCIPGVFNLDLKLSGIYLESNSDDRSIQSNWIEENFKIDEEVIVYLERHDGKSIFNYQSLKQLVLLTNQIKSLDEINERAVYSLSTEGRDRIDSFNYLPFLEPIPSTSKQLEELENDIIASKIITGSLISADRKGLAIIVGLDFFKREKQISVLIKFVKNTNIMGHTISLVGAPIVRNELGEHILRDLGNLLPFIILIISLLFWAIFNSKLIVFLSFLEITSCIIFTFGMYGYIGNPIFLSTAILPIALISICLLDELHIFSWFQNQQMENPSKIFYTSTYKNLANAIGLTTITSALGFLSFSISDVNALRLMGIWATVGMLFCLIFSLMILPSILSIVKFKYTKKENIYIKFITSNAIKISKFRIRKKHFIVFFIFSLCIIVGLTKLNVQESWQQGFSKESSVYKKMDKVNKQLFGTHVLRIGFFFEKELNKGLPLLEPSVIEKFSQLESVLRNNAGVGEVLGPYYLISVTKFLADGRPAYGFSSPETSQELRQLWRRFEIGRGKHRRQEVVNDGYNSTVVNVYIKEANYIQVKEILNKLDSFHKKIFLPLGARYYLGGDILTSQKMIEQVIESQLKSALIAIFAIFVCLTFMTRSIKKGLILALPLSFSCIMSLALMGWLNLPLGIASSIFLAICIGIGADFAIHSYLQDEEEQKTTVAYAILCDIVLLIGGFSVLLISNVPANVQLGFILIVSTLIAAIVTFISIKTIDCGLIKR